MPNILQLYAGEWRSQSPNPCLDLRFCFSTAEDLNGTDCKRSCPVPKENIISGHVFLPDGRLLFYDRLASGPRRARLGFVFSNKYLFMFAQAPNLSCRRPLSGNLHRSVLTPPEDPRQAPRTWPGLAWPLKPLQLPGGSPNYLKPIHFGQK